MRCTHARKIMDAIQGRILPVRHLVFDVRRGNRVPWAVTVQDAGINGLLNVLFFMLILILGLAYAWKKGALEWK